MNVGHASPGSSSSECASRMLSMLPALSLRLSIGVIGEGEQPLSILAKGAGSLIGDGSVVVGLEPLLLPLMLPVALVGEAGFAPLATKRLVGDRLLGESFEPTFPVVTPVHVHGTPEQKRIFPQTECRMKRSAQNTRRT